MDNVDGQSVVSEVPETLKQLTLFLTKSFYGLHHYVVVDYIQRLICIREDRLRDLLKIDQKFLRHILVTLKVDKFVKERQISEETDGRAKKTIYYHVNYKAILNVAKYKIDHMRQRLEQREQSNVQKASYVCTGCNHHYDSMDVGQIYNPELQQMICWQCNQRVIPDETAVNSEVTRSSMAKFNEQMGGIFSMLQQLDGIRFSRGILEPPILKIADEPKDSGDRKIYKVGERMFSSGEQSRADLYSNGITVSIGDKVEIQTESKAAVPWLQHNTHEDDRPTNHLFSENSLLGTNEFNTQNGATDVDMDGETESSEARSSLLDALLGVSSSTDIGTLLLQIEGTAN